MSVVDEIKIKVIMLLDLMLPNGKLLRDCTGVECRAAGGWLVKIADRVGDGVVGEVLSENEALSIFNGA